MDNCPDHRKQYSLYCQNCDSLLCLECLDSHGRLGHVILSSQRATALFRENVPQFQRHLKDTQKAIEESRQSETLLLERSNESFEEFSGQILSVFKRIEEMIEELKTAIFTKYMAAQEGEQRSSAALIQQLVQISSQLETGMKTIESTESDTPNWIEYNESIKDLSKRVLEAGGCRRDAQSRLEQIRSRARPTAATVALEVLQTLRTQLQRAEEQLSAGSSLCCFFLRSFDLHSILIINMSWFYMPSFTMQITET